MRRHFRTEACFGGRSCETWRALDQLNCWRRTHRTSMSGGASGDFIESRAWVSGTLSLLAGLWSWTALSVVAGFGRCSKGAAWRACDGPRDDPAATCSALSQRRQFITSSLQHC